MKLSRAALFLIGLLFAMPAAPAQAAEPQVSLTVGLRWEVGGTQGIWTPYVVTVKNSGKEDFSGDVYLIPNAVRIGPPDTYPVDRAHVAVARGSQRSTVFYVIDAPNAYQAQVQTLKDFVGLGGVLVEAGGPSWRRTLLPLPSALLPLAPQATTTSSLAALWELGGRSEDVPAQVASGLVRFGQVSLAAADGTPLIVDAPYGAGRVVEMAFDPFGDPFASDADLAGLAWSQAISRGLSGVEGATRPSYSPFGGGTFSSVAGGA